MTVKMYRGIDNDGMDSLFAVKDGKHIASSLYIGVFDSWLTPEGFGNFTYWLNDEMNDQHRDIIDRCTMIWER